MPYSAASFISSIQLPGSRLAVEDLLAQAVGHVEVEGAPGQRRRVGSVIDGSQGGWKCQVQDDF
jgi:hypothetical protein